MTIKVVYMDGIMEEHKKVQYRISDGCVYISGNQTNSLYIIPISNVRKLRVTEGQ